MLRRLMKPEVRYHSAVHNSAAKRRPNEHTRATGVVAGAQAVPQRVRRRDAARSPGLQRPPNRFFPDDRRGEAAAHIPR
jgi:hypothetical protein